MTKNRSDIHRPQVFDPEDYEWVDGFNNQPPAGSYVGRGALESFTFDDGSVVKGTNWLNAHDSWLRGLVSRSDSAVYGDCFQCDHCGARIRYVGVFKHLPSGDHIAVGETCAEGRFTYDKATFDALRKAAALDRAAQRILTAWNAYKADHAADWDALYASDNYFIADVLAKGRRYGDLSERQFAAICKALVRDRERDAQRATQAAVEATEVKVDVPVTDERLCIVGTVLSTKYVETDFGGFLKMLIKVETEDGVYKLWGTVPSKLTVSRGDIVRFNARLEVSRDDKSFGFFSRPTKAEVLDTAGSED